MTQHFNDTQDTARLLADSLRDLERELYQAQKTASKLERQRDAADARAQNYAFTTWLLVAVVLALSVVLAGFM